MQMTQSDFFAKTLGAKLRNIQWSWGAFDRGVSRVFLRVWSDDIEKDSEGERVPVLWKLRGNKSLGYQERLKHIELIEGGVTGFGVLCEAVDTTPTVRKRRIKTYDAQTLLRLGKISREGNEIYARILGKVPISELTHASLSLDIARILTSRSISPTTSERLVDARIGQGQFRLDVLKLWNYRCAVTGAQTLDAIRASHIKPWARSSNVERLDPYNGLPLVANLDALFDAGLISFSDEGEILISPRLCHAERNLFGLSALRITGSMRCEIVDYLRHHRDAVFKKAI